MACNPPFRDDSEQMLLWKIASCCFAGGGGAGVSSFNGRTGAVTLTPGDVATVADDLYVNETGDSMTGALSIDNGVLAANDPALELSQTWNNAAVDFKAFTLNVTNTAAGSGSMLLDVQQDAITRFTIFENGSVVRFVSQEQTDTGLGFFLRKRGTAVDATAAIASGGGLANIFFSGWNGAAFVQAASIRTVAEELFTGLVNGTRMELHATPIGSATPVVILRVSGTGINLTDALAYQYNSVNVIRAQTALSNYFFGPSGNLTMTGNFNVALGGDAFIANTTGIRSVAIGHQALLSNTTGNQNVAIGYASLLLNTTGARNVAVGYATLLPNTSGSLNVAIGYESLRSNTTGSQNVSVGYESLFANTTGADNLAAGYVSLTANTTGSSNVALGRSALGSNTTSSKNSAVGFEALLDITTAATGQNTAVGYNTGRGITTGNNNTIIGANVTGLASGLSSNIIISDGTGTIRIQVDSSGNTSLAGNLSLNTAKTLSFASGANTRAGNATLVAGTVTVANTSVTANTIVMLTRKTSGGTLGTAITYTVIAATSFTINSDSALDTSTFSYVLIENP